MCAIIVEVNQGEFTREIYQKYEARLRGFIAQKVSDEQDVEEILQDTFVSAFDSSPTFSGRSSFFTWLCGIAKHEIADFYRKRKIKTILSSRFPFLEGLADQALGPEEELIEAELKREIRAVFRKLSEGYREVLRLKYIDGYSVAQIAEELGTTFKAVESRLFRARKAFAKIWEIESNKSYRFDFSKRKLPFSS